VTAAKTGATVSSLDLVAYDRFTLIVGADGEQWTEAGGVSAPWNVLVIGRDVLDPDGTWTRLLALDPRGAILVRPDQHVAWRSRHAGDDPMRALETILGRTALAA
jgi:2,4-dichlorophenol 6-monooxygenase